jgi:hypothetical protein
VQHVALVESHPLTNAIRALFAAERERAERLIDRLRDVAKRLSDALDSAWIQGGISQENCQKLCAMR